MNIILSLFDFKKTDIIKALQLCEILNNIKEVHLRAKIVPFLRHYHIDV